MRYDRAGDKYKPVSWDEAFELVGRTLRELDSPDEAIFYTSGRTSNEAAFLYQLFVRLYGTNNMPDCSNMCHESSGSALGESIGIGKGTVQIDDFEKADAIFVVGQNPGTNHPRMLSELEKAAKGGCKIVAVNPLKERGLERFIHPQHKLAMMTQKSTDLSTLYLQPTVGGDMAMFIGMIKLVLDAEDNAPGEVLDHDFIKAHTLGLDELCEYVKTVDWETIERESALSKTEIEEAADVYLKADRVIICWAMGLTQHKHAVATIQQAVNLLLLRGNIGKPGAGACPVRGHSNVQGDRTMGIYEKPAPAFLDSLGKAFNFTPPYEHGYDTVDAIKAMADGRAKVFFALGGNFAHATPDTPYTEAALQKCKLTVQVSTKLNRSHITVGQEALIFPCLGRTELDQQAAGLQRVTVEDSMSQVHASHGRNKPASEHLLSEPAIVAGVAKATFAGTDKADVVDWDNMVADYGNIRDKIEQVLPTPFKDYNERIKQPGGFYLGNSARDRSWTTGTGKANFVTAQLRELALPGDQLRLMTLRSHDQYNTTIYDLDDRYRGIYGTRKVILLNGLDIQSRSLRDGDLVDITSHTIEDGQKREAFGFRVVEYDIPKGCAACYFPETNVLVSVNSYAEKSRTPLSKFIPVTLARADANKLEAGSPSSTGATGS